MTGSEPYISPEYNPHALDRVWGLFVAGRYPAVIAALDHDLTALRSALRAMIVAHGPDAGPPLNTGKVTVDGLSDDPRELYRDAGLDILALALLADVPAARPLHITQNSLLGHWRWLRQVWRYCNTIAAPQNGPRNAACPHADEQLIADVKTGCNNRAIAALRREFHDLSARDGIVPPFALQSFLANLALFCPFIGTELCYRHGMGSDLPVIARGT